MMLILGFIFLPLFSFSQTDPIQREIDFVSGQKQALEKQLIQLKSTRQKEVSELNRNLDFLHREKARLATELELLENDVAEFSRLVKKQTQSQNALSDRLVWTKAKNAEMEYFLPELESSTEDSLTATLSRHGKILASASQVFTTDKSYLNSNQSLTQGKVFHLGPFARFLYSDNQWKVLALTDSGYYAETKETSFANGPADTPFVAASFVQLPFSRAQPILKEKNVFNRIMDLLPGLFLGLVFFSIGWIFIQLAKN